MPVMNRVIWTPTPYLRRDKQKQNGAFPVYVRFQRIGRKEPKFPLGIEVAEGDWAEVTRRPKNLALKIIVDKKVARIEQQLLNAAANELEITHDLLRRVVDERDQSAAASFYGFYNDYVQRQFQRGKIRESTRTGYELTYKMLKEYRKEIKVSEINTALLAGFDKFLMKRGAERGKGDVKGGRSNHLKHLRAVLNYISRQGIKVENPYAKGDLEIPKPCVNNVFLEFEELSRLVKLMDSLPPSTTEYRVLCMFLFSCATGLRLGDTLSLKWSELDLDSDPIVLEKTTQKTGKQIVAPIHELGRTMIEHAPENEPNNVEYEKLVFLCCRYSPVTINKTLRKLAEKAGIEKYITYHCSRRTFVTLALMQGADIHTLAKYVGHSSIHMTHQYAKTSKNLIVESAKRMELFKLKDILGKGI